MVRQRPMIREDKQQNDNFIKFVGTAGARFVTINQMRSSGGIWISFKGTNLLIDPGPGSLVKCLEANPRLDPSCLDAIVITHKHIDHSNDINIMIEAMTKGGSQKKGVVFLPGDMLNGDSILLQYARGLPERLVTFNEKDTYAVGAIRFTTPLRHIHSVETYGLKFTFGDKTISFIVDTRYSNEIAEYYKADIVIINTVFIEPLAHVDHLSLRDAGRIIAQIRPQKAILTHFGRDVLNRGPEDLSRALAQECGIEVIAARDGMSIEL